ncbi:MAG TPA: glycosyltransferase [Isosphaeraceae bacterium]|jgi:glycosyltransferase involved in cell wall biosynthesis|nr:glycosyltransferase [Isosphaeraceae bacterium]
MDQDPLHLLCVEPRFPGRLGAVADWLVRARGFRCHFYCATTEPKAFWPPSVGQGLDVVSYKVGGVAREASVAWSRNLERSLCYAYGCWEALDARRPRPVDAVLGRSADLGSTLFVPVYAPGAPVVNLFDYFFPPRAGDLADEAGPDTPPAYYHWRRASTAVDLLDLENGVTPWTTSAWQRDLYPPEYRDDFVVLHDGVDHRRFRPRPPGSPRSVAGRAIPEGTRVVSFIARSLDRLRGFDRFLALSNLLLKARADVICIAVGDPVVRRGLDVTHYNQDYRAQLFAQSPPHDPERFWALGAVAPGVVTDLLSISDLHVYPGRTYPVSRSLVEAMMAGRVILAADSAPLREFLEGGESALLAPPGDVETLARLALAALDDPAGHRPLGEAAAAAARERFAREVTLPRLAALLNRLVAEGGR